MSELEPHRQAMLELVAERGIRSPRVLEAMARVPRERFVSAELAGHAYDDRALPIECGQTISQPYIVALMTDALQLEGTERVLEIGTGSGYQTAVLAELVPEVFSIERHADLSQRAGKILAELGYTNVTLAVGDGSQGWPAEAPFDRILVAAAARRAPTELIAQLAEGGTLVIPLGEADGQTLVALHKQSGGLHAEYLSGCRFVPLVSEEQQG